MQSKLKKCSVCGRLSVLWKSSPPTCKNCIPNSPLKKISKKHKNTLIEYKEVKELVLAKKLKEGIRGCEIKSPVCTGTYEGMHHIAGKESKEKYLDPDNMMLSCNLCNLYVEENPIWAYDRGIKIRRNQISV